MLQGSMVRHAWVAVLLGVMVHPLLVAHAASPNLDPMVMPRHDVEDRIAKCSMGGVMVDSTGCQCYNGFNGTLCEYSDSGSCSGHGNVQFDGTCACSRGFTGYTCSESSVITPVISTNSLQVSEGGQSSSYTVQLSRAPEGTASLLVRMRKLNVPQVLLLVSGSETGEAGVELQFDRTNWDVPRELTVVAIDDPWVEGPHEAFVEHTASTGGAEVEGSPKLLRVNVQDNDTPEVLVSRGLEIVRGNYGSVELSLERPPFPGSQVLVKLDAASEKGHLSLARTNVTFESHNYNRRVQVGVFAPYEHVVGHDVTALVHVTVHSTLVVFNELLIKSLEVTVVDTTRAALQVQAPQGGVTVNGSSDDADDAHFEVSLSAPPEHLVQVSWGPADDAPLSEVTFTPRRLQFTKDDWMTPKRVQVKSFKDGVVRLDRTVPLNFHTSAGSSAAYHAATARLDLRVIELDRVGLQVARQHAHLCDLPGCATAHLVSLGSKPSGDVTVHVSLRRLGAKDSEDQTVPLKLSRSSVLFTPANWSTQIISVQVVQGDICPDSDRSVEYLLTHTIQSADAAYADLVDLPTVTVEVVPEGHELSHSLRPRARELQAERITTSRSILFVIEGSPNVTLVDGTITVSAPVGTNIIQGRVYMENAGTGVLSLSEQSVKNDDGQFMFVSKTSTPARTQITLTPTVVSGTGSNGAAADFQQAFRNIYFEDPGPKVDNPLVSIVFEVTTSDGVIVTQSRSVVIELFNNPPFCQTFNARTDENRATFDRLVCTDPEEKPLLYKIQCQPGRGSLNLTNAVSGDVVFRPFLDIYGPDSFLFLAVDDEGKESTPQVGTLSIQPQNSKPIARNITLEVNAGKPFVGYFTAGWLGEDVGSYDPDNATGTQDCERTPSWCITTVNILGSVLDPGKTQFSLVDELPSGPSMRSGQQPFSYLVETDALSSLTLKDQFKYTLTDGAGLTSNEAFVFLKIVVQVIWTPPMANDVFVSVLEGSSTELMFNGTDSQGTSSPLGYYIAVDGLPQGVGNISLTFGEAMMSPSPIPGQFLYGDFFTFFALDGTSGSSSFFYMVQDQGGNYSTPGLVTVNVRRKNRAPMGACAPGTRFIGDKNVHEQMANNDLTAASLELVWYNENFPDENRAYSDMIQIFLNTSYEILCDGPLTSPIDGAPNACADRTGSLVCRDAARLQAKMSHNASAAMALPFVQGGADVAMLAYDEDGGYNLTQYRITKMPTNGRILFNSQPTLADPFATDNPTRASTPQGQKGSVDITLAAKPGLFMGVTYFPDSQRRGIPLDSIKWVTTDMQGGISAEYEVTMDVKCMPGYFVQVVSTCIGSMCVDSEHSCSPCPPGSFNQPTGEDQRECALCQPGTFSLGGATVCTVCPANTYQDEAGAAMCIPCADALMISMAGSIRRNDCQCNLGSWATVLHETCELCDPASVICNELDQVIPKPISIGAMVDPDTGGVLRCIPIEACLKLTDTVDVLNMKCHPGYESKACKKCLSGYFRNIGDCDKCPSDTLLALVLPLVIVIAVPLLMLASGSDRAMGSINVLVNYIQIVAIIRYFKVDWSNKLKKLFDFCALFNFDWFLLAPECYLDLSFPHKIWMISVLTVIMWALMAVWYLYYRYFDYNNRAVYFNRATSAFLLFLNWTYLNTSVTSIQYFSCVELNGENVLRLDPNIKCNFRMFEGTADADVHRDLLSVGFISLALYPLGVFVLNVVTLQSNKALIRDGPLLRAGQAMMEDAAINEELLEDMEALVVLDSRYGFLYKRLDAPYYWWELFRFARKLAMCLVTAIENPQEQLVYALHIYAVSFLATLYAHPNDHETLDVMDTFTQLNLIIVLVSGFVIAGGILSQEMAHDVSDCIYYIVIVSFGALLMFVFADFKFREVPDDLEDNYDKEEEKEEKAEAEYDPNKSKAENEAENLKSKRFGASLRRMQSQQRTDPFMRLNKKLMTMASKIFISSELKAKDTAVSARNLMASGSFKMSSMRASSFRRQPAAVDREPSGAISPVASPVRGSFRDVESLAGESFPDPQARSPPAFEQSASALFAESFRNPFRKKTDLDVRKEKTLEMASVLFRKGFVSKLAKMLDDPACSAKFVLELQTTMQALTIVAWENRDFRKKGMGEVTDDTDFQDAEELRNLQMDAPERIISWAKEQHLQARIAGMTLYNVAHEMYDGINSKGVVTFSQSFMSDTGNRMFFTGPCGTPFKAGVMSWGLRRMGVQVQQRMKQEDVKLLLRLPPKQISLIETDKIMPLLKWLAFNATAEEQRHLWQWANQTQWKLAGDLELQNENRQPKAIRRALSRSTTSKASSDNGPQSPKSKIIHSAKVAPLDSKGSSLSLMSLAHAGAETDVDDDDEDIAPIIYDNLGLMRDENLSLTERSKVFFKKINAVSMTDLKHLHNYLLKRKAGSLLSEDDYNREVDLLTSESFPHYTNESLQSGEDSLPIEELAVQLKNPTVKQVYSESDGATTSGQGGAGGGKDDALPAAVDRV